MCTHACACLPARAHMQVRDPPFHTNCCTQDDGTGAIGSQHTLTHTCVCTLTHTQDDGTGNGAWRNGLLFKPLDRYNGFSYYGVCGGGM